MEATALLARVGVNFGNEGIEAREYCGKIIGKP